MDQKGAEHVKSGVGERRHAFKAIWWQVSHLLCGWRRPEFAADDTGRKKAAHSVGGMADMEASISNCAKSQVAALV